MSKRYKIRVPSGQAYREVYAALRAVNVPVFVASEKRRVISSGSIPANVLTDIKGRGATVSEEQQYSIEERRRA